MNRYESLGMLHEISQVRTITDGQNVIVSGPSGEYSISAIFDEDNCGQACLTMQGYPGYELFPPPDDISTAHFAWTPELQAKDVTEKALQQDYRFDEPHMLAGEKTNGRTHWVLIVGDKILDPDQGNVIDSTKYIAETMIKIEAVMKLPFGPNFPAANVR